MHTENFPKREDGTGPIYDFDLITETWRGMEECVRLGLVKNINVSNFNSKQLDELLAACTIRPCVNQVEAHPLLPHETRHLLCRAQDCPHRLLAPGLARRRRPSQGSVPPWRSKDRGHRRGVRQVVCAGSRALPDAERYRRHS